MPATRLSKIAMKRAFHHCPLRIDQRSLTVVDRQPFIVARSRRWLGGAGDEHRFLAVVVEKCVAKHDAWRRVENSTTLSRSPDAARVRLKRDRLKIRTDSASNPT